jgi:hypothetical protein
MLEGKNKYVLAPYHVAYRGVEPRLLNLTYRSVPSWESAPVCQHTGQDTMWAPQTTRHGPVLGDEP